MSDIIIYGRGRTGLALQNTVRKLGYNAVMYDDEKGFDIEYEFSKKSLVVTSPGVKPTAKGLQLAKNCGAKIVSELDFCFPHCKSKCVSVTGTNGKTTTCQIIHHILQRCGVKTRLLGNGGVPFSTHVLDIGADETTVLESSSFQLDNAEIFSPYISVVTNVADDHLDYHGDYFSYLKAKCNNFCHQKADAFSVFNADDNTALEISENSLAYTLYYSTENSHANCYYYENSVFLHIGDKMQNCRCKYLSTLPRHNLSNALCGILVCNLLGVDLQSACDALQSYIFLPHRLQNVGCKNGVTFVNDSKATNVHATVSALKCYRDTPLALILGGSDKGCEFDEIFTDLQGNVKFVCAVGETAQKICLTGKKYMVDVTVCDDYKQAVYLCYRKMSDGGIVLMSNACASFDMFDGYASRGEHFVKLVEELCSDTQI